MKLYISIPISGRPIPDAVHQAEIIKMKLEHHGHECITPFDVCPETGKPYAYYMGRDIEALLADDIEGVVFGYGFENSKGCQLEHAAAVIYGKHIVYQSTFYMLDFEKLTVKQFSHEKVSH
ncbi:MAG: DUF4406 domain-containing protein [Duncaniella sp.]|nr:DUF4406 domain-containing protein [Duncaniella sp.]